MMYQNYASKMQEIQKIDSVMSYYVFGQTIAKTVRKWGFDSSLKNTNGI